MFFLDWRFIEKLLSRMRILFFLIFIICIGCKPDKAPELSVSNTDLVGEWIIYSAMTNGKSTRRLEKGYFVFQADKTIKSNLFGDQNSYNFKLSNNMVRIEGHKVIKKLIVKKLSNDSLALSSKMNVYEMDFFLTKK